MLSRRLLQALLAVLPVGLSALYTIPAQAEASAEVIGAVPATVTVSGRVWNDLNRNGIQDSGEPGVPGVGVISGSAHADTGRDGRYTLPRVELGAVSVEFVVPRRYLFSPVGVGADDRNSDAEAGQSCGEDCAFGFTTLMLTEATTVDAGVYDPATPPPASHEDAVRRSARADRRTNPLAARAAAGTAPMPASAPKLDSSAADVVPPRTATRSSSISLADTGVTVSMLVALGLGLVIAGLGLLSYARRDSSEHES